MNRDELYRRLGKVYTDEVCVSRVPALISLPQSIAKRDKHDSAFLSFDHNCFLHPAMSRALSRGDIADRTSFFSLSQEFEDLCFEYGIELDEITSEKEMLAAEQGADKAEGADESVSFATRFNVFCLKTRWEYIGEAAARAVIQEDK